MTSGRLMTDNLPTIAGMGVVSHATDTMFRRRGGGTRKRVDNSKRRGTVAKRKKYYYRRSHGHRVRCRMPRKHR